MVLKEGSSVPLREVAVIKPLPGRNGLSLTSHVCGLGVRLHDIVFCLPCGSATVALSFRERWFYTPTKWTEEPLYAKFDLDFIDITDPVENLVKKLYRMYEHEQLDNELMKLEEDIMLNILLGKQGLWEGEDHHAREELRTQQEEQKRKKLEDLRRRRDESKKQKHLRKEIKEAAKKEKEQERQEVHEEEPCIFSLILPSSGESDWAKVSGPYVPKFPSEEELRQREERRNEQLEQCMRPIIQKCEPSKGWVYSMDKPYTQLNLDNWVPEYDDFYGIYCFWRLSDKIESNIQSNVFLYPTSGCLEWCGCTPHSMLQVYTLEVIAPDSLHCCKVDICGFFAIRDDRDGRRNYIFRRDMEDPFTAVVQEGVVPLPTIIPRRGISPRILLEYDMKIRISGYEEYKQLIQGIVQHPSPSIFETWSRVTHLSIQSGDHSVIRLKLAMIQEGVVATIELLPLSLPPQGIYLRCAARTGQINDDIVLFYGRYTSRSDDTTLKFAVATELRGNVEIHLRAVCDGLSKSRSIEFESKFHALFSQEVDFGFARFLLTVAWSM